MKKGQRVYINGSLGTTQFKMENGKTRSQIFIRSSKTLVLDNQNESENTSMDDVNEVNIVANVARSASAMQNGFLVFPVATHYQRE